MVSLYPYVAGSAWAMIATGIATVIATSLITAPYGKFMQSKGWGIMIPAKIAWLIMESPNVWMLIVLSASLPKSEVQSSLLRSSLPHQVFAGLFLLHYIHRDIIFPLFLSRGNPMPFTVMFLAFSYCSWNSFNQFMYLLFFMNYPADYLASPRALGGISLFFIGMFINMHSDYSLLFQKQQKASGPSKYIIPRGFLYEWLSCPNYCKGFLFSCPLIIVILRLNLQLEKSSNGWVSPSAVTH